MMLKKMLITAISISLWCCEKNAVEKEVKRAIW